MVLRYWKLTVRIVAALCIAVGILSCEKPRSSNLRTNSPPDPQADTLKSAAEGSSEKAAQLVRNGKFEEARALWELAQKQAKQEGKAKLVLKAIVSRAGCQFALYSYREALLAYLDALQLAQSMGDSNMEGIIASNIASLHYSLGEADKAKEILAKYPADGSHMPDFARLDFFLIQGNIYGRLKDYVTADKFFQLAVQESALLPSSLPAPSSVITKNGWTEAPRELRRAWVFEVIGQSLMERGLREQAEAILLESFRLRTLYRDPVRFREALKLGMLMRERGDFSHAQKLFQVVRNLAKDGRSPVQMMSAHREEAKLLLAQNQTAEAMQHLHSALQYARAWRLEVLPSDSTFLRFESYLNTEVHNLYLNAAAKLADSSNDHQLASESFWVAEEARFASMRAEQFPASTFRDRLPREYWSKLNQYQALQGKAEAASAAPSREQTELAMELSQFELQAGLAIPHAQDQATLAFQSWQKLMSKDELLFSYYFDEPYSLVWTVSANTVHLRRIAGRGQLRKLIQEFRNQTIKSAQDGPNSTGLILAKELFGDFLESHRTIPFWNVVLDDELSSLPLAALPTGGRNSHFLAEEHAIRVLTSAIHLKPVVQESWRKRMIALSDPIYNSADSRRSSNAGSPLRLASFRDKGNELSRLPLSAIEAETSMEVCRRAGFAAQSLTGPEASLTQLRTAIATSPDILHLATHVVAQGRTARNSFVALSTPDVFGPLDLNTSRSSTRLVVLSGCNSTAGEMIPGIGVAGLSRAWLISGSSSVVSTLWPTKDVPGPFFPAFYEALVSEPWSSRAAAIALQRAQQRMIKRKDWYSQPAYWAAYIPLSRG